MVRTARRSGSELVGRNPETSLTTPANGARVTDVTVTAGCGDRAPADAPVSADNRADRSRSRFTRLHIRREGKSSNSKGRTTES